MTSAKTNIFVWLILSWFLSQLSASASESASSHEVEATARSFLRNGFTGEVKKVGVLQIYSGEVPRWTKAVQGTLRHGVFSLRALGIATGREIVDYDMQIEVANEQVSLKNCQAEICSVIVTFESGTALKSQIFTVKGQTWSLQTLATQLCEQGVSDCMTRIGSRSLASLRNKDGLADLSDRLLVVQESDGLSIVDYNSRRSVLSIGFANLPVKELGDMRALFADEAGQVVIDFQAAVLLVDLVWDQVSIFSSTKVYRSSLGGGFGADVAEERYSEREFATSDKGVSSFSGGTMIADSFVLRGVKNLPEAVEHGSRFVGAFKDAADRLKILIQTADHHVYQAEPGALGNKSRVALPKQADWRIVGDELYYGKGRSLIHFNGSASISPSFGQLPIYQQQGRFVLVATTESATATRVQVFRKVQGQAGAFQEVGALTAVRPKESLMLGTTATSICLVKQSAELKPDSHIAVRCHHTP